MDPSQHSASHSYIASTGALVLLDCVLSWLAARGKPAKGVLGPLEAPSLRIGVRAGEAVGIVAILSLSGLPPAAAVLSAVAAYLLITAVLSDHILPRRASQRAVSIAEPHEDGIRSERPSPGLSVVASRAKRLEALPVSRVMVPRKSIVGCESSATVEHVATIMRETGYSRIIAYSRNIDRPLGLAHIKDVLPLLYAGRGKSRVEALLRPLVLAPGSQTALDLLRDFQRLKRRVAIVRDLHGERTLGLVTTEDILEELVGEIHDEWDRPLTPVLESGVALVRADLKVEELLSGAQLQPEEAERGLTVGALMKSALGKEPAQGDAIYFKSLRLTVEETANGDIWMIRVEKVDK